MITRHPHSFVPVACPMTSAECRPWAAGRCSSGLQPFPRPARAHAGPHAGRVGRSRPLISTHIGTAQGAVFLATQCPARGYSVKGALRASPEAIGKADP
jgi:hypothetical protein